AERFKSLGSFLDELVLDPPSSTVDIEPESTDDFVTLSTVHSAKGLEWPIVFIIWVMEGYFPSARAHSNPESIEEERRLMYVATTRAKDSLILCYPGLETLPVWQLPDIGYRTGLSSFIRDVPEGILDHKTNGNSWSFARQSWPAKSRKIYKRPGAGEMPSMNNNAGGLRTGDRVMHPAFGKGVVSKFVDSNKVEVLFSNVGRKLLHMEHTTLTRI
ncbi:MAG: 3'-5' exonuclease, partial [Desulfobacteraceae bacterium]